MNEDDYHDVPTRGRSTTRKSPTRRLTPDPQRTRIDPRFVIQNLDSIRRDEDYAAGFSAGAIHDMQLQVRALHKAGRLPDPTTYDKPGEAPNISNFLQGCTYLNLCKVHQLRAMNPNLAKAWEVTIMNRRARSTINAMLGEELEDLLKLARDYITDDDEITRFGRVYRKAPERIRPRVCRFYTGPDSCRMGINCDHLHLRMEQRGPSW